MKSFFYSFYGKLSAVLLFLLLVVGIAQLYITYQTSMRYVQTADQKLNRQLAENMAAELQPHLEDSLSESAIKEAIHYLMVINPRVEIYLLDGKGTILTYFAEPPAEVKQDTVPLEPVRQFLESSAQDFELIVGPDPKNPENYKPFSAAPLELGGIGEGYLYIILSSDRYNSAMNMIRDSYIFQTVIKILGIILGVTAIVGLLIFALLTRRLRNMTEKVEAFEQGDRKISLEDTSKDEIGQLARSFNRMSDTIKSNVEELKKTDTLRRNLIANVSHDLRSPLASMQGYLETILIKDSSLSKEERDQYLQTVLKNTTKLRKMVDELFELSKLDAQQIEPEPEPFSIPDLVQDVILKLKPEAAEQGVELKSECRQKLPQVFADIGLIERVLTNLLENAIRHSEPNSTVSVLIKKKKNKVQVAVRDTGSGIRQEDLPHIFDRFFRADRSRSLSGASTGLGLAIAKKMLQLNGSDIEVESAVGEGTTFYFSLETV